MSDNKKTLEEMREQMDTIDRDIMASFIKRMELSARIAEYKKARNLPVLDIEREKAKLDSIAKNVPDEMAAFTSKLYLTLADLSRDYQEKLNLKEDK